MPSFCSEGDCGTKKLSGFSQVTEPVSGRGQGKAGLPEGKKLSLLKVKASAFLHGLRKTVLRFLGLAKC